MWLPIEYEWEDTGTAGVGTTNCVTAGAGRLCTDIPTEVEVIIMGAGAVAGFPFLCTVYSTHVQSQFIRALFR